MSSGYSSVISMFEHILVIIHVCMFNFCVCLRGHSNSNNLCGVNLLMCYIIKICISSHSML